MALRTLLGLVVEMEVQMLGADNTGRGCPHDNAPEDCWICIEQRSIESLRARAEKAERERNEALAHLAAAGQKIQDATSEATRLLQENANLRAALEIVEAKLLLCYHDVGFVGTEHRHPFPGPCQGREHAPVMCLNSYDPEEIRGTDCIEALRIYREGGEVALYAWVEKRQEARAASASTNKEGA